MAEKDLEAGEKQDVQSDEIDEESGDVAKPKKERKVVRRRKSKKEKESPLVGALRLTVETGKVDFGHNVSLKKKAKLLVIANNVPSNLLEGIVKASKTHSTPILEFDGNSIELGSVCGKPFPVTVLSVYDAGSSNLLEMGKKK
ncbi:50S ribosomal protein L30e [Candidatus Micrarchaeota archaeon]|nr:50S ribosomal protein L30e [Candidatus Micrarchaeota archaeon]